MRYSLFILIKGSVLMFAGFYVGEPEVVTAGLVALTNSPLFVIIETV